MATSIDQLLARMDDRLERAVLANDPAGYFCAVYRAVTARVRDGLHAGEFDDNDRMERFDVTFGRLYVDAAAAYEAGRPTSRSWDVAFAHTRRPLLVMQHVLLGMNAHINLDLGIAAAEAAADGDVAALRTDFERINEVLAEMVDRMQAAVAAVSPWTAAVDRVGLRLDEALATWSLAHARGCAWDFATELVADEQGWEARVAARDAVVARLGTAIARPGWLTRAAIGVARRRERDDVGAVVAALRERGAPVPD